MQIKSLWAIALLCAAAVLSGCDNLGPLVTQTALNAERSRSDLVRKEITTPDGSHIVYLEGGQGEPLVLVHGFGADKDNFTRIARWLTPHYRVIIPDLIGFGESSHLPDADYRFAAQAARMHAFAKALGVTRAHWGGNSMGGGIVLSLAAQHPQDVGSLWLLDPAGIAGVPPSEMAQMIGAGKPNPLIITKPSDLKDVMKFVMTEPPYLPDMVIHYLAQARIANQALEHRVFQQLKSDSVNAAIQGLTTPTLIVWGAQDRVLSADAVPLLKSMLPQAQSIVLQGVGHMPMIERPKQSAEDYLRFRAQIAGVVSK